MKNIPSPARPERLYFTVILLIILFGAYGLTSAVGPESSASGGSLVTRVAPGDFLPISVKLTNFGGVERVDVTIEYRILDQDGGEVLVSTETVAVETTASFIKVIQIPLNFQPGVYTAESSIYYGGQDVPAIASYQFTVERKIAGIFLSNFIIYAVITGGVGLVFSVVSRLLVKRRRTSRFAPQEYSQIPPADRMYYEIISDIIMQMRTRVGDKALVIAKSVPDIVVDESDGRVLAIKGKASLVIASLIAKYDKLLDQKVNFAFSAPLGKAKDSGSPSGKNLVVIKKY